MIVGSLQIELHLPMCHSLKEKRSVVTSLLSRLRQRHNVSAAEVDHHDVWQTAQIGVTVVSNETKIIRQILNRVLQDFDEHSEVEVTDHLIEIL